MSALPHIDLSRWDRPTREAIYKTAVRTYFGPSGQKSTPEQAKLRVWRAADRIFVSWKITRKHAVMLRVEADPQAPDGIVFVDV